MKKGFVFDLDGVITDTADYHYAAWKDLAASIGIEIDIKFNEKLKGVGRMESLEMILIHGHRENDFSKEEKENLATKKNRAYRESLKNLTSKDILPGAENFLKKAKEKKMLCSLASASKNAPYIINKLGVTGYFDAVVDAKTIKKSKPNPEIYEKGAHVLGLKPSECVGFEDAQAGIDSIKSSGMYAVGVVSGEPLTGADITVTGLDELSVKQLLEEKD